MKPPIFSDPALPVDLPGGPAGQAAAVFASPAATPEAPPALTRIAMGDRTPVFADPAMSPGPAPDVVAKPTPIQAQIGVTNDRLKTLQAKDATPYGSPDNHPGIGGKILHALSVAGNIAGDIFAPSTMSLIPGTQLNRKVQEGGLSQRLQALTQQDLDDQQKQAQTAQTQASTDYTRQRPAIEQSRVQQRQGIADDKNNTMLAKAGLQKDGDGNVVANEDSPAFQSRQVHDQVEQSRQQLLEADEEVKRASIDPNSPAYQLAVSKASTARVNAGAAVQRAQAYYGNYLQHAYNKGLDGSVLAGAPQIEDGGGNVTTVGSTNAGQAVKAQTNVAQFNDVHGALDGLEGAARQLVQSGGALNSPAIIYALQHKATTPSQFLQSLDKANLSPQERAYVIAIQGAHENVQALRKAAGGTATDSSVAKLDNLIPNGTTPDLDYLLGQTKQIRATAERLGKGVTTVAGGAGVRGGHSNQGGGGAKAGGPQPGDVVDGYKFKGGNAGDQKNWEKQ